jgi:7,8-dihydroneopterin aldolase/epimerase/oxygenase
MGKIALEKMKFFAYHGYYKEEQTLGNHFLVDVYVETNFQRQADHELPIDHDTIYWIVKFEMEKSSRLLENVGKRIIKSIVTKFPKVEVLVRIRKCNPPLGGVVQYSLIETSGRIGLEGMEFFAPIGTYKENKIVANEFIVDVYVNTNFDQAAISDNLADTLNYEAIFWAAKMAMTKPANAPEEAGLRIADNLKSQYKNIFQIEVNLKQKHPPMRGQIQQAAVKIEENHIKQCPKCKGNLLCYNDQNCWCQDFKVLPATRQMLNKLYKGCLCTNCLRGYAVK